MYTIELDVDPVTLGFDPKEVTRNDDGTYIVTRRFVHAKRYNSSNSSYEIEAYCPCLTDNVEIYCYEVMDYRGRITYGVKYVTNDGAQQSNERRSWSNSIVDAWNPIGPGMFNRQYDTHIESGSKQEKACSFCVSKVNDHPANISSCQAEYLREYHIVFGKSAPTSPYEDPFLPEKFKQMLNNA